MNKLQPGLDLYLIDAEKKDGIERWLDLTIRSSPSFDESSVEQEVISSSLRRVAFFSESDIQELKIVDDDQLLKKLLFAKFGIHDFETKPGLPSGPYFGVDPDVISAIRSR